MRAVYLELENMGLPDELNIAGDAAHHLIKVVRLKENEKLLLMNGKGLMTEAQVKELGKRDLKVQILKSRIEPKRNLVKLAIAVAAKEAMEDVLRQSVELGITHIQPLLTQYSEKHFEMSDRQRRVLESALIQSNNPYFPEMAKAMKFEDYLKELSPEESYLYFSSRPRSNCAQALKIPCTLIIGPEGGFSETEESALETRANVKFIHLPSYILRTPTAVCTAAGLVFGSQLK